MTPMALSNHWGPATPTARPDSKSAVNPGTSLKPRGAAFWARGELLASADTGQDDDRSLPEGVLVNNGS